jgi:DNA mismatch repair protein MutS2
MHEPRLRSASVGFDFGSMRPSFELLLDVPGASSALSVAERFGIPHAVVERARAALPEQSRHFGRLAYELGERARALAEQERVLASEQAQLAQTRRQAADALAQQRKQGDQALARELQGLLDEVKRARAELDAAQKALRKQEQTREQLVETSRRIDKVAARVALGGDLALRVEPATEAAPDRPLAEHDIRKGLGVYVPHLRSDAVVIEGPNRGKTRVAAGPLKLWVSNGELRKAVAKSAAVARPAPPPRRRDSRGPDNTLNIRGMRVDDALGMIDSFVDRIYGSDLRVGYVLHGHGSGALREAVRKHLQEHAPLPLDHVGPAEHAEGGDAVTVFQLAEVD